MAAATVIGCGSGPSATVQAPAPVTRQQTASGPQRPPPPEPHADFSQLRPYRNYYRVVSVGEYRHHFVVFYHDSELALATYDAPVDGSAPPRKTGGSFGLVTTRPAPEPIPDSVRHLATAIAGEFGHTANAQVIYLGAYRALQVQEIIVLPPTKTRSATTATRLTLAANEDLSAIDGTARYAFDTGGRLRLDDASNHADVPSWIDADLGEHGERLLWRLYQPPSPIAPAVRTAFEAALLTAALRRLAGEAGTPLAELAVARDPRPLPADLATRQPFIFLINGVDNGRQQFWAETWFDYRDVFGGSQRMRMALSVPTDRGSRAFNAEITLHAPALPTTDGQHEVEVTVDYRMWTRDADPVTGTSPVSLPVFVDGDRFYVTTGRGAGIPMHTFPGIAPYDRFEAHLNFSGD